MKIWTIGHSTRSLGEFITLLRAHDIGALLDVRRFAASRRHPQFNREIFAGALAGADIEYQWMPELGGRRRPKPDSHNSVWRNESFRGYADYMESAEFERAIERLLIVAGQRPSAIMCAEAVWWQCHRSLIADYLASRGVEVQHILSAARTEPHRYTAPARLLNGRLTYAAPQLELGSS